jgi:acyl carrier protein
MSTIWERIPVSDKDPIEHLREYYKETFKLDSSSFTVDTHISETGIDSLEAYNLLYELENTYSIRFDSHFLPITLGDLLVEVNRLKNAKI